MKKIYALILACFVGGSVCAATEPVHTEAARGWATLQSCCGNDFDLYLLFGYYENDCMIKKGEFFKRSSEGGYKESKLSFCCKHKFAYYLKKLEDHGDISSLVEIIRVYFYLEKNPSELEAADIRVLKALCLDLVTTLTPTVVEKTTEQDFIETCTMLAIRCNCHQEKALNLLMGAKPERCLFMTEEEERKRLEAELEAAEVAGQEKLLEEIRALGEAIGRACIISSASD